MTSGVDWNEDYADPAADVNQFYAAPVEPDMDATDSYLRKLRRELPPGQRWHYNTGETNLLGVVVARATGKDLATYAAEKIWAPYGMEQAAWWMLARSGDEHVGCCIAATTRDFACFGQFVLDGARIDWQSVVADGWLQAATSKQVDIGQPGRGYGYPWLWAPARTCRVLAGFKMLTGLRPNWRDTAGGEAHGDRPQVSAWFWPR